jgi:uncharacterized membrane protein YtjA (UPF0391 family)
MVKWTIVFLIDAIIAAVLGFGGVTTVATDITRISFFVFLALFVLSLIFGHRVVS